MRRSGTPTAAKPATRSAPRGRRGGAPRMTTLSAPANQPTRRARSDDSETGDTSARVVTSPSTTSHATRRHRRDAHGPAPVATAAATATASSVGPACSTKPLSAVPVSVTAAAVASSPCPQKARKPERQDGCDGRRKQRPPATTGERNHETADDHHQTENPGDRDRGGDEPRGHRVQASQEVRSGVDEPVARTTTAGPARPGGRSMTTMSRSTSHGDRCAVGRGESITSTGPSVRSSCDCTAMLPVTSSVDRTTSVTRGRPRLYPTPRARSRSRTDRSASNGRNFVIRA